MYISTKFKGIIHQKCKFLLFIAPECLRMWTTLTARETYAVAVLMSVIHNETFHSKLKCHPLASLTLSLMESLVAFK